jgi:hypothetical protein
MRNGLAVGDTNAAVQHRPLDQLAQRMGLRLPAASVSVSRATTLFVESGVLVYDSGWLGGWVVTPGAALR